MKLIIGYLIACLVAITWVWSIDVRGLTPDWLTPYNLGLRCGLIGALGGIVYCLRAIYLNKCVKGEWDSNWNVWYYLRPLISFLMGGVAYIFLNAGLLILAASHEPTQNPFGFLALSFIAGLNVDRFIVKIEDIAQSTWGIRPSRSSEHSSQDK
ncbi:hypothetical protein BOW50_10575 [Solemya velum gill symbiont]|uniref:hypothetical protein n=1 Tax=Solemya velum gill symbiont TaxID=2340 RepID=UPI0009975972|nr:hypothetical protein [Solemya velum gill symbiont]OOZ70468.1 hypothetical protein BOW48_11480 [Solemya velum gill symbiont]OOZ76063.1 hypothetical protein BOW50_10575 [Solemya velum gill symbiont]